MSSWFSSVDPGFEWKIESLQDNIKVYQVPEFIAYCYFDGKIEQGSKFEVEMCETAIDQIKSNLNISGRCLALYWIYFQAHAINPLGEFIKVNQIY